MLVANSVADLLLSSEQHVLLVGNRSTMKSSAMAVFAKQFEAFYRPIRVPLSAHLTLARLRTHVESFYQSKAKNTLYPRDWKHNLLLIDDVHLHSNLEGLHLLEFLRMWSQTKGYFDPDHGAFKRVPELRMFFAANDSYRRKLAALPGRHRLRSFTDERFLYGFHTVYMEEPDSATVRILVTAMCNHLVQPGSAFSACRSMVVATLCRLHELLRRKERYAQLGSQLVVYSQALLERIASLKLEPDFARRKGDSLAETELLQRFVAEEACGRVMSPQLKEALAKEIASLAGLERPERATPTPS